MSKEKILIIKKKLETKKKHETSNEMHAKAKYQQIMQLLKRDGNAENTRREIGFNWETDQKRYKKNDMLEENKAQKWKLERW